MRYLTQTLSKASHLQKGLQPSAAGVFRSIHSTSLTSASASVPVLSAHIRNNVLSKSTQNGGNSPIRSLRLHTLSGQPLTEVTFFPAGWDGGRHPDDFKIVSEPIKPEFIFSELDGDCAVWYRTSFKTSNGFVPSSVQVSTGAPSGLYVTEPLRAILMREGRIDDKGMIKIADKLMPVEESITTRNVNVIGLGLIKRLGLALKKHTGSWKIDLPNW